MPLISFREHMANCTGSSSKFFVSNCDISDECSESENLPLTAGTSSDCEISMPKSSSTSVLNETTSPKINFSGQVYFFF